ncbi:MAG: GPW/gp25 family protein [Holosporales bacterium]|jgi:type VI secretion system lysozyme-like protein|nr:GPW/gp25 family protein [Holosporales bacterium]
MAKNKIDVPFLYKFNEKSTYIQSKDELYLSITEEIGNILSSKLKIPGDFTEIAFESTPFSYGVRDIQSIETSNEKLEKLKTHYRKAILNFEPRLSDVEVKTISVNNETQTLKIELICTTKIDDKKFATEISSVNR